MRSLQMGPHLEGECSDDPGAVGALASAVDGATHHHSWWSTALHVADDVAAVGGVAIGVAALAGVSAPMLPIAGAVIGGYFAARAIGDLVDRGVHHQSLDPLTSAAARDDYLMGAAGALGGGAIASGARLVGVAAAAAGAATLPDAAIGLAHGWSGLGTLQRGLAVAQIGVAAATLGRARVGGEATTAEEDALRARAIESGSNARAIAAHALLSRGGLPGTLDGLLADPSVASSRVSLTVADGEGHTLFANEPDLALNPASNSKIATAAFALDRLGADHRFETPFRVDAAGNLHVEGGFDPSIDGAALGEAAAAIRAAGVTRVGDLVLDDARIAGPHAPSHYDEFGDADWEYLAPPAALASNKGLLTIEVRPGPQQPRVTADSDAVAIDASGLRTVGPGAQFHIGVDEEDVGGRLVRDASGKPIVRVWGTIASDYPAKTLAMKSPDPLGDFGSRLRGALDAAGVRVDGGVREGTTAADARTVFVRRSPPLAELLASSLAKSNAFDHEVYAAAASAETHGGRTSVAASEADLHDWLAGTLGHPVRFDNASGLGDANRLSSSDIVKLLSIARRDPRLAPVTDSLARPGQEGTLRLRMVGSAAEGRLRAKTGTMEGSIALSGVTESPAGTRVFSALVDAPRGSRADSRAFVDALGIVLSTR